MGELRKTIIISLILHKFWPYRLVGIFLILIGVKCLCDMWESQCKNQEKLRAYAKYARKLEHIII